VKNHSHTRNETPLNFPEHLFRREKVTLRKFPADVIASLEPMGTLLLFTAKMFCGSQVLADWASDRHFIT